MSEQVKKIVPIRHSDSKQLRIKMEKALEDIERVAYTDPDLAREIYNERREAALERAQLNPDLSSKVRKQFATAQPGDGRSVVHQGFVRPVDADGNQIPISCRFGLVEIVNQCKSIGFPLDYGRLRNSVSTFIKAEMDAYDPRTSQPETTLATMDTTAHSTKRPRDDSTDDQQRQSGSHAVKRARSLTLQDAAENSQDVGTIDLTANDDGIYADVSSEPHDTTVGTRSLEMDRKTGPAMLLNEPGQITMFEPSASQQLDASPNIGLPLRAESSASTAYAPAESTFKAAPENLALASSSRAVSAATGLGEQTQFKTEIVNHRSGLSSSHGGYNSTSSIDPTPSAGTSDDQFPASSQEEKELFSAGDQIEQDAVRMKAHMT